LNPRSVPAAVRTNPADEHDFHFHCPLREATPTAITRATMKSCSQRGFILMM
jgi:hypothetical protein